MSFNLYGFTGNPRTASVRIVAEYEGINLEYFETDIFNKDNLPADFKEKFPLSKVPALNHDGFLVTETPAIAFYLASQANKSNLFGQTTEEKTKVLQWANFGNAALLPALGEWFTPIVKGPFNKKAVEDGKAATAALYAHLNQVLESKTFLVGERITYADIIVATVLQRGAQHVVDPAFFSQYPNVLRYFHTVLRQPQVVKVQGGEPTIIDKPKEYVPVKKEKAPAAAPAAAAAPKAAKAPKKKEVEQEEEEEESAAAQEPKAKHPCDLLGKPTLNLEDWKRKYSNEDTPVAMKWFEENYKPDEYSLWKVQYKYNEELTQVFMSANLIGGFHNRLEGSRKHLMGSSCVYGTANNSKIQGAYVCRGQSWEDVFQVAPDWESYEYTKLDFSKPEDREYLEGCWAWTNKFDGLEVADGKVFK